MQLVLFVGLQASGKTTFYVERFLRSHAHVNLDQLRTRHREQRLLDVCLETKTPVVVDNTNPTKAERNKYIEAAKTAGYAVHLYFFRSRVEDCLQRNEARPGDAQVPRLGILGTSSRLQLPTRDEGFDAMFFVRIADAGGFVVEDWRDEVR